MKGILTFRFLNHHHNAKLANARTITATTGPAITPALTPPDDESPDLVLSMHWMVGQEEHVLWREGSVVHQGAASISTHLAVKMQS